MTLYADSLKDQIIEQYFKIKQAIIGKYEMYVLLHNKDYYEILREEHYFIAYSRDTYNFWGMPIIVSSDIEQGSPKVLIDIFPKEKFRP